MATNYASDKSLKKIKPKVKVVKVIVAVKNSLTLNVGLLRLTTTAGKRNKKKFIPLTHIKVHS